MPSTIIQWSVILACLAISSCIFPARNARVSLDVSVAADANARTPIPVDLVFVWDEALTAQIAGLTARDWFAAKPQFRRDDPNAEALTICEWEWVPGQDVPDINVMMPAAARRWIQAVFLFADYRTVGPHRFRIAPGTVAALDLLRDDATLRAVGTGRAREYALLDTTCPAPQQATR